MPLAKKKKQHKSEIWALNDVYIYTFIYVYTGTFIENVLHIKQQISTMDKLQITFAPTQYSEDFLVNKVHMHSG